MFFVLRLWIVAWTFAPTRSKNLPLMMAATEPSAVMEGSEFDKAFAVVNAMFEQIAKVTGPQSGRAHNWNEADSHGNFGDHSRYVSSPTDAFKQTPALNSYFIKAKDSDFILIDPLDDHDRNAAALSKMVQGSFQRRQESQEDAPGPTPLPSPDSGEDHHVAATEDSKEQDENPHEEDSHRNHKEDPHEENTDGNHDGDSQEDHEGGPQEDHEGGPEEEEEQEKDQGDQLDPGPEDRGEDDEDPPVRRSRAKERDSREIDEDEEDDDEGGAPLEGAPVTEDDLDDFAPETFMPPTVLGVARHYKVGSSFSVFPVHIPNAPEHVELGSGVPTESQEEDEEEPVKETEDEEEEDMEPHATTSSHHVVVEPAASEHDEEEAPVSSKKGHRVSQHGDDETYWIGEGGGHEADEVEHDTFDDHGDDEEEAEKFKKGSEKSNHYKNKSGAKKSADLKEAYDEGKHQDDGAGEEDEGADEYDKYRKKKMEQGFHDKYNFDKRTSRNRFYKNRRKKGDWTNSGEDEHTFYKNVEGDEAGSFGKYKESSGDTGDHGGKKGGHSSKKSDKWKKSKSKGKKDKTSKGYERGKRSRSGRGYYSWKD